MTHFDHVKRLTAVFLFMSPSLCLAESMLGDSRKLPVWERMWYEGTLNPPRWYDGIGPLLSVFVFIFLSITLGWYLLRRLLAHN